MLTLETIRDRADPLAKKYDVANGEHPFNNLSALRASNWTS
jgi:hypothetical protein